MEEDIKILEQFLVGNKYCEDCKEKCVDCYIKYEEVQAVANLLKAYKELEEFKKQVTEIENTNFIKYKNYIPVSLVEETLEELKQEYKIALEKNSIKAFILKCQIQAFKEFLEKRK